jgi:ribosomal-protein-alanine N-acetyltransferase
VTTIAVGPRVVLRRPAPRDRDEFLTLTRASRRFHQRWSAPPTTPETYAAWLRRYRRAEQVAVRGAFQGAYLGYWVGKPYAAQGYMRDAFPLVLRHAFVDLRLHRVEANIQPTNRRSLALVRHHGFRREGFSRRYLKIAGRWRDHERWALLVEAWRGRRARDGRVV